MDIDSPSDKQTQSRDDEGSERMEGNSVHGTNEARERSDREDGEDEDEDEVEFDSPVNSFSGMLDGEEPLLPDSPLLGEALDGAPARTSSVQDGSNSQQGNSDDGQEGSDASDSDPDEEDEEEEQVRGLTVSEREILTLLAVDKKLASVLDLAATALSALHPSNGVGDDDESNKDSAKDPLKTFQHHAGEYYKVLDDIQLTLRSSIHQVRRARILPRALQDPQANLGSVLRGTIAHGALAEDDNVGLSVGATRMEQETWQDIARCLEDIKTSTTATKD